MSAVADRVNIHCGFLAILFLALNDSEMPINTAQPICTIKKIMDCVPTEALAGIRKLAINEPNRANFSPVE